ncbi:MAG: SGNH/GDSL hydrolase family protein, partial [Rhodothermales bacterium]|nr:SGNH/GDSL hydrolase family protein [Rhodothermales bacterium]
PGTYRIAVLGGSYLVGGGVDDDETFENLLEDRLNREWGSSERPRFELWNYGLGDRASLTYVYGLRLSILPSDPDAIFLVVHHRDFDKSVEKLAKGSRRMSDFAGTPLGEILERAGVTEEMPAFERERRLLPFDDAVVQFAYGELARQSREAGVTPVWVYLPITKERGRRARRAAEDERLLRRYAEEAGFETVSLSGLFEPHDQRTITLAPWDDHPNRRGHRLIADSLYAALRAHAEEIGLPPPE